MTNTRKFITLLDSLIEQDRTIDTTALYAVALKEALERLDEEQAEEVLKRVSGFQENLWNERDARNTSNKQPTHQEAA